VSTGVHLARCQPIQGPVLDLDIQMLHRNLSAMSITANLIWINAAF
jgi:hypothetical protein